MVERGIHSTPILFATGLRVTDASAAWPRFKPGPAQIPEIDFSAPLSYFVRHRQTLRRDAKRRFEVVTVAHYVLHRDGIRTLCRIGCLESNAAVGCRHSCRCRGAAVGQHPFYRHVSVGDPLPSAPRTMIKACARVELLGSTRPRI